MASRLKKVIAAATATVLAMSLLGSSASALQYTGTGSYMSGQYYRQLKQVSLTGDPRTDIVAIARSQVGYQEGNSINQLTGEVYGGTNFTEYGAWYGMQEMWCAMFVSWCADRAGISTDTVPSHAYTPDGLSWFAARGQAYTRAEVQSRKYTPRPGDLIYFKTSRNAKTTNHIGIITDYSGGRVYTVEGNVGAAGRLTNGGMVAEHSYPISNTYIVFICAPNYESGSTNVLPDARQRTQQLQQKSLREAIFSLETGERLRYDAVSADEKGSLTLGCGQWYGTKAVQLLRQISAEDAAAFGTLDPEILFSKGTVSSFDEEQQRILAAALSSETGVRIQNAWMDRSLEEWTARAADLGVTDRESLLLCAALYQLRGNAGAERIISAAGESPAKDVLLNTVKDLEPGLYRTCSLLVE